MAPLPWSSRGAGSRSSSCRLFSNLVHYIRAADFVETLFRDAQNVNELAFALGALSHYASDIQGHALATNERCP